MDFSRGSKLGDHSFSWQLSPSEIFSTRKTDQFSYRGTNWIICVNRTLLSTDFIPCVLEHYSYQTICVQYQLSIEGDDIWASSKVSDTFRGNESSGAVQRIPMHFIILMNRKMRNAKQYDFKISFIPEDEEVDRPIATFFDVDEFSQNMADFLEKDDDFDVILTVMGKEMKAHRTILKARSPVFRRMFEHKMQEQSSGQVQITDCNADAFRAYLQYLYSGKVVVTDANASDLYRIANKYDSQKLLGYCSQFMISNLEEDRFCDVVSMATTYCDDKLLDGAVLFLSQNMQKIVDSENWKAFIMKNSLAANELISKGLQVEIQNLCHDISPVRSCFTFGAENDRQELPMKFCEETCDTRGLPR